MWRRRNCSSLWPAHNRNRDCQETSILNINTCENGWSNFSANLRVVALNLLELTQFSWLNLSIYFYFSCAVCCSNVMKRTRFLMRPPVIIRTCSNQTSQTFHLKNIHSHSLSAFHTRCLCSMQRCLYNFSFIVHIQSLIRIYPQSFIVQHTFQRSPCMLYTPHSFYVPHPFRNPPSQPIATQVPSAAQVGRHSEFPLNY